MTSIASCAVSMQTSPHAVPSTPSWFGEVAVVAHYLTRLGLLERLASEVHFARARFGQYEVLDFVAVLIGYALSGEATLRAFYERLQPFATPFMALFGRRQLPHRSTLSRFLAALDQPTVEALRSLCWLLGIYVLECNVLRLIERAFLLNHTTGMYNQCGSFCVDALNTHLFL